MTPLHFTLDGEARAVTPTALVIAGWTGRDTAAIEHHIEELGAIGVPRPSRVPLYYRATAQMLTQSAHIEALGTHSSGEAEPVLFFANGEWWLTVGSDHTDRQVETYSVAVSKQLCAKPVAAAAWRWADVAAHQDRLELSARILEGDAWADYQRGTLAAIRPLAGLRDGFFQNEPPAEGAFMMCGTLGVIPNAAGQGIRPAARMEVALHDPVLGRRLAHRYEVHTLPLVS